MPNEKTEAQKLVLVVEDEKSIADILRFNLELKNYRVSAAYDGEEGLAKAREENPDLILLDIMLPKMIGFDVCEILRKEGNNVPIILLTAREEEDDKVKGLEIGADDYITKPFLPEELILRVTAVLRRVYRVKSMQEAEKITLGRCTVDLGSGVVHWENGAAEITLTAKEYAILQKLSQERGRIVTIDALCDAVWQEENFGYENTLVVHIRRLREKIEEDPSHPKYLLTVRGLGYRLV